MGINREMHGQLGIRSTMIYPGEVNTPILANRPVPVPDDRKAAILQPEDVAAAVQVPRRASRNGPTCPNWSSRRRWMSSSEIASGVRPGRLIQWSTRRSPGACHDHIRGWDRGPAR